MSEQAMAGLGGQEASVMATLALDEIHDKVLRSIILVVSSRSELYQAMLHHPRGPYTDHLTHPVTDHLDVIDKHIAEVDSISEQIVGCDLSAGPRGQLMRYIEECRRYVSLGLRPACEAILDGEFGKANKILLDSVLPLSLVTIQKAESFVQISKIKPSMPNIAAAYGAVVIIAAIWIVLNLAWNG